MRLRVDRGRDEGHPAVRAALGRDVDELRAPGATPRTERLYMPIRVGIVGAGNMGTMHARDLLLASADGTRFSAYAARAARHFRPWTCGCWKCPEPSRTRRYNRISEARL